MKRKAQVPWSRRMASSKKLTLFLRAMPMLPKLSLWSTPTEIKETRRAKDTSR
ncbi:hypothetical protein G6554_06095 [Bacillus sp. MM2020_4]|nr:hypothetical protein [Bacillus sp. MM2020_4]